MTLIFELGLDFCTTHPPTKFHHPVFNRSEVIVLTNKQADAAENIQLAPLYATPVDNAWRLSKSALTYL